MKAARVEAARAMSTYTFAAVEARKLAGEMVPMDASQAGEGKLAFTLRLPIGVVGAISPFNFPLNLVAHKLAPALAAGCAVVLKPASADAALGAAARRARGRGRPAAGLAQRRRRPRRRDRRRPGRGRARARLITFTGSGAVGWELQERAPRKRVNLELGNATPVIVDADADLDAAATALAANAFAFAGQSCISVQRIYVERAAYDELRRAVRAASRGAERRRPGRRGDRRRPRDRRGRRASASSSGSTRRAGGRRGADRRRADARRADPADGDREPAAGRKVSCEEVFGPVVHGDGVDSLDEAIELANGTRFGLQAGIFTTRSTRRCGRRRRSTSAA